MSLNKVSRVRFNNEDIKEMYFNGDMVWTNAYRPLNYLQGTGNQYINMNVSGLTDGVVADFEVAFDDLSQSFCYVFGTERSTSPWGRSYFKKNYTSTAFELGASNYYNFNYSGIQEHEKVHIVCSTLKSSSYVNINNVNITTVVDSSARADTTYGLFTLLQNGITPNGIFIGKIYWFKLYDKDNNLIRDFIPVLDSNSVPCMLDKVSGNYFYNQGTNTFLYG